MKPFQIQRIDNISLDESFRETLHIHQNNDKQTDKKLILGKYDLNPNEKSTRTLDVIHLNTTRDHFIVIEDRIIKEFKLIDNKILKGINCYRATGSIKCCMKIESVYGNLCLIMDNDDIVILDLIRKGFVYNKTVSLATFLMGQQLLPLLSSTENFICALNKQKDQIIEINLRNDTLTGLPLKFNDFGEILHFDCYCNQDTYHVLVFHIHKISNIFYLEIFQTNNYGQDNISTSLFRKKTFKIDKINQHFQLLEKIENNKYIIVTLNNIILVSGISINIRRWTINHSLKKRLTQLTNNVTLFYHENNEAINLKICDSYLRTINVSCCINEPNIQWDSTMNKTTNNPVQSMFFLKTDMIYIRDAFSGNKIAYIDSGNEGRDTYIVDKVHDKWASQYGSVTYHCGLVRTNSGSIFQNYILGGTESSQSESFIEHTSWQIIPYKNIKKITKLNNNSGVISKIVTIKNRSLMVFGETIYQLDHKNGKCNVGIQDFNPFERYLTRNGNIIVLPSDDIIFCADVINTTSTATEQEYLLTINSEGMVRVSSYKSQQEENRIYYERKHDLNGHFRASAAVISYSDVFLLLCEGEYLQLYVNSILVSKASIRGMAIRDCFIVKVDKDLTKSLVLLSFDCGKVILLDLTLKNVHFEILCRTENSYKLLKNVINHNILVAYQDKSILFIDFKNWKTSFLNVKMNIRELSYTETEDMKTKLLIVDNTNGIHWIDFETSITINENKARFKYNSRHDLPVSMHELNCSGSDILVLSKNLKSRRINLNVMNIENGEFIYGRYNIPAVDHITICSQRLSPNSHRYVPMGNCLSKDIFIVTYTKEEGPFYEILEVNPTDLFIKMISRGKLKIVPNLVLITNVTSTKQFVTFLGSGIETKDVTYHIEESGIRHITVTDLNYITELDTFPFIGGEVTGEYIKTVNIRGIYQIYKFTTLELVTEKIRNSDEMQILSAENFLKPFTRQILKADLVGEKEQTFYRSPNFSDGDILRSVISSIMGEVTIPDNAIFASLNTNNELVLSRGMKELHEYAFLCQPSIHIPHDLNIKNIIPIPNGLKCVIPKYSHSSNNKFICMPMFMIIGERSTCYIIVKCPADILRICDDVTSNGDMFSSKVSRTNYIHSNLYSNSSEILTVQLLEFR